MLQFRCLVQLKPSAELEGQDGFFQQRLPAQRPLGLRPGSEQMRSCESVWPCIWPPPPSWLMLFLL